MNPNTFKVRIVRPVFESVVVEVEADSEEEAVAAALGQADTITEEEWTGAFEPENYFYDAQCIEGIHYYDDEGHESDGDEVQCEDDLLATNDNSRYLLLKANTFSGEGEVLYQPWLEEVDDLMLADLCMDWSGQIEEARKGSFSLAIEIMKDQMQTKNKKPAKILQFKRPIHRDKIK